MHARFWWGSQKEKRPRWRPRRRWTDNIKMDLREVGWGGMDQINLAQGRDKWRNLGHGNELTGSMKY
jgi:hypothetical protein